MHASQDSEVNLEALAKQIAALLQTINGGAQSIGSGLQRMAPDAWRIAVKQVYVSSVVSLLSWFVVSSILWAIAASFYKQAKVERALADEAREKGDSQGTKEREGYSDSFTAWAILSAILGGVGLATNLISNVVPLLNPEYAAALKILELVKGG